MDCFTLASRLVSEARHNGGATVHRDSGLSPVTGFAVGGQEYGLTVSVRESTRFTVQRVAEWLRGLSHNVTYVGSWRDGNGTLYFDAVTVTNDAVTANHHAIHRGELAFYGLHNGQTYPALHRSA